MLLGTFAFAASAQAALQEESATSATMPQLRAAELGPQLEVGDLVFIRVPAYPFRRVAQATGSWTNHVGIVVAAGTDPTIAESTFPLSRATSLSHFVARSDQGRLAVDRLDIALSVQQQAKIAEAAARRYGIFYDTGFNLHSRREFCSRYVREVLDEATGVEVGEVETFSSLLKHNPNENLSFWRVWYFGKIPWQRETVTPASVLNSAGLHRVFDGKVLAVSKPRISAS